MLRLFISVVVLSLACFAESGSSVSVAVQDPTGAPLKAQITLASQVRDLTLAAATNDSGEAVLRSVPPGRYVVSVSSPGFEAAPVLQQVSTSHANRLVVRMKVAAVSTHVDVAADATLLDPTGGSTERIGGETLAALPASTPGRGVIDAVQSQPGWIVEANGVLHPRGSEYDTTVSIDGFPVTSNQSPVFSPGKSLAELDSVEVRTSGYPAEYGRRLGGVVELTTARSHVDGLHGSLDLDGGSFSTADGSAALLYGKNATSLSFSANGFRTDRYLDPPDVENFTNTAVGRSFSGTVEHQLGDKQTLRLWFDSGSTRFDVPNEISQQLAGQKQSREVSESSGYFDYTRIMGASSVFSGRLMLRDAGATLDSNESSTPAIATQDRGLFEATGAVSFATEWHSHNFKTGVQFAVPSLRERFDFQVTDPAAFDKGVLNTFAFDGRARGDSVGVFAQDQWRHGNWTFSYGLRWDRYRLLVEDSGFSPRMSVAYFAKPLGLVLHASYDRVFQEPPQENLLLASSSASLRLGEGATQLPVPLSRGDFGEVGLSKMFFDRVKLDASAFLRNQRNFGDDDVLLNTGVSLPTTFSRASIYGTEIKLDLRQWARWSGFASYSYQLGRAITPVTGGLFLDAGTEEALNTATIFPVTQDQRSTLHTQVHFAATKKFWIANSFWYGSGLPTELEPDTPVDELVRQFGAAVVSQVDFARNRVRPSHSIDFSAAYELWRHENRSAVLQLDAVNVTDKLNVVNFAGLFSGTALSRPRSATARLRYAF